MFMRIVRSSIDPAKIDDALALTDEMIAAMNRQPGFVSTQGGINRATGALTTISTWKSQDAATLPVQEILGDILDRLQTLGVEVESVDTYEVTWSA
jgi:hypothetical protein